MQQFTVGQCWLSDTEQELGLGCIIACQSRRVEIQFLKAQELRTYTMESAPLSRVNLQMGDLVIVKQGFQLKIETVELKNNLFVYQGVLDQYIDNLESAVDLPVGAKVTVLESDLLQLKTHINSERRLLRGDLDSPRSSQLRRKALSLMHQYLKSPLNGLIGPRIDLMPHQFYIAFEASRYRLPRVLLADEVGLGKTIESGLIIHHCYFTEKAKRILILTPESLVNQWFIELYRRFKLPFNIIDAEVLNAQDAMENPFSERSLVLSNLDWASRDEEARLKILAASWDLVVVDETHQLAQDHEAYYLSQQLASQSPGLVLISATPDQQGNASLFELLRLIDPDRYYYLPQFEQEQQHYQTLATALKPLLNFQIDQPLNVAQVESIKNSEVRLDDEMQQKLHVLSDDSCDPEQREKAHTDLLTFILDQQGTGRVIFRNTRSHIGVFANRQIQIKALAAHYQNLEDQPLKIQLHPEQIGAESNKELERTLLKDPRLIYLISLSDNLPAQKILVITAHANTALAITRCLRRTGRTDVAAFHEQMSLLERDRAAAYFADPIEGAKLLICSEIGSEGRNFQFCSHLFLFDLPLNPGLLEQRIGRLDRIGQRNTVTIHIPYFQQCAMERLFRFHHEGLNVISKPCNAAAQVFELLQSELEEKLFEPTQSADFSQFIKKVQNQVEKSNKILSEGRDLLLEYNSCRKTQAERIISLITDTDHGPVREFFHTVLDYFGLDTINDGEHIEIIQENASVELPYFPNMSYKNVGFTFDRATAMAREEVEFLSFEHPTIQGLIDLLAFGQEGGASCYSMVRSGLGANTLWMCLTFKTNSVNTPILSPWLSRFFPTTGITLWVDQNRRVYESLPLPEHTTIEKIPPDVAKAVIKEHTELVKKMIATGKTNGQDHLVRLKHQAQQYLTKAMGFEIKRLIRLAQLNPAVKQEDVEQLQTLTHELYQSIEHSSLELDICELVVVLS